MEHFLWVDTDSSRKLCHDPVHREKVADEVADVLIYALRFADVTGIDPAQAILDKLARNENRYPIDKAKGSSAKYDELR